MTTTINASTSAGLVNTADTSGILQLQTAGTAAVTIDASQNVGIGVTPAGTGGCLQLKSGITFPATQSASSDVNTLDDYEEGTWTPSIFALNGFSGSVTVNRATYTKIGRVVTLVMSLSFTSSSGNVAAGDKVMVSGMPFSAAADNFFVAGRIAGSDDEGAIMETRVGQNSTNIRNVVHSVRNPLARSSGLVGVVCHYEV